jgi:hypothetical protein
MFTEIAEKIHKRISARDRYSVKGAHEDFAYALLTAQQHVHRMECSDETPEVSSMEDWNTLLQSLRQHLKAWEEVDFDDDSEEEDRISVDVPDAAAEYHFTAERAKDGLELGAKERARTEWLVAGIFHYLVKSRLASQRRRGVISNKYHAELNEVEQRLQNATLLSGKLWDSIVRTFSGAKFPS